MLRSSKLKTQDKKGRRAHQGPQDCFFDPQCPVLSTQSWSFELYLSA